MRLNSREPSTVTTLGGENSNAGEKDDHNIIKYLFAAVRDVVRGRTGACEEALRTARARALREMSPKAQELGAYAVIGVDIDYEVLGKAGSMLMVTSAGTAVKLG